MNNLVNQLIKKSFLVIAVVLVANVFFCVNKSNAFNLSSVLGVMENEENFEVTEVVETERLASLSGEGTEESPYIISTVEDLNAIRDNLSAYYKLGANIDLQGVEFEPLGAFTGVFDGDGKTISNLTIHSEGDNIGLFSSINGTVTNLYLIDIDITGNNNVGAIAGSGRTSKSTKIESVYISGNITGNTNVGGIVGLFGNSGGPSIASTINKCYSFSNVTGNTSVGGVIGSNYNVQTDQTRANNSVSIVFSNLFIGGKIEGISQVGGLIGKAYFADSQSRYVWTSASQYFYNHSNKLNVTSVIITSEISGSESVYADFGAYTFNNTHGGSHTFKYFMYSPELSKFVRSRYAVKEDVNSLLNKTTYTGFDFVDIWNINEGSTFAYLQEFSIPDSLKIENINYTHFAGGNGTPESPYKICTKEQLYAVNYNNELSYELGADIDLEGFENWEVFGDTIFKFNGTFDGKGYSINNLTLKNENQYNSIFGVNAGIIKNVVLNNIQIEGGDITGILAAKNIGNIENIKVNNSNVKGQNNVGAIVAINNGVVKDSSVSSSQIRGGNNTGGLIGQCLDVSNVSNCYTNNSILSNGNNVGGLVGFVDVEDAKTSNIERCYSVGTVEGMNNIGGFVGNVTINNTSGIVRISNCFATASAHGVDSISAGMGYISNKKTVAITNMYAIGEVTGETNLGGLVGLTANTAPTIMNSYFVPETNKVFDSCGGKTNNILRMVLELGYKDWDFDNIWAIDEENTLAYLRGLPLPSCIEFENIQNVKYFEGGNGEAVNPYIIKTAEQLKQINYNVEANYVLGSNINLNNIEWEPIGIGKSNFNGKLDGNGYKITNLTITSNGENKGLFSKITGKVCNIGFQGVNIDISDTNYVGVVAAINNGEIENIKILTGSLTGNNYVGALVGNNIGTIKECNSVINIRGIGSNVGGLVGINSQAGSILKCYARGTVDGVGNVGGLVGNSTGSVEQCYSTGNVVGTQDNIGGLVGICNSGSKITDCYTTSSVLGRDTIGGLVGDSNCTIKTSYAIGEVTQNEEGTKEVGGLVGKKTGGSATSSFYCIELANTMSSPVGTSKTITELVAEDTYEGYNFTSVWTIDEGESSAYLKYLPTPKSVYISETATGKPVIYNSECIKNKETTKSLFFEIEAQDDDAGIKQIDLYIDNVLTKTKKYTSISKNIVKEEFEVDNLQQNTEYSYYFIVTDITNLTRQSATKIASTAELKKPTISVNNTELTKDRVVVTITADLASGQYIQYKTASTTKAGFRNTSSILKYKNPVSIYSNKIILARVTDGYNFSEYAIYNIDNIDRKAPKVTGKYIGDQIRLRFEDIGKAGLDSFAYVVSDHVITEDIEYGNENSLEGQSYYDIDFDKYANILYVKVWDKLGNITYKTFGGYNLIGNNGYDDPNIITLQINKINEKNNDIKIEDVTFSINAVSENGQTENVVKTTDENGIIQYNVKWSGKVKLDIKEIDNADGYILDEGTKTLTVNKILNVITGNYMVEFVQNECSAGLNKYINGNRIFLNIENSIEEDRFGLAIVKHDLTDKASKLKDVYFMITDITTNELYSVVTGETGIAYVNIPVGAEAGTYTYKIAELDTLQTHNAIAEERELNVTYDANGRITNAVISGSNENEYVVSYSDYRYVQLEAYNERATSENEMDLYDLTVIKLDSNNEPISDDLLGINIQHEEGVKIYKSERTDSNGRIEFNGLNGSGTVIVKISNINSDNKMLYNDRIVYLEKNETTGVIELESATNADVDIDNENRTVVITVKDILINEEDESLYLTSEIYTIDNVYCDRVSPNTSIASFVGNLESNGTIRVFDKNGVEYDITDTSILVTTSYKVRAEKGTEFIEKDVIVVGDYNEDGIITISDVAAVNKYFLGAIPQSEKRNRICDVTGDNLITISDVGKLNKFFLGAIPILINY